MVLQITGFRVEEDLTLPRYSSETPPLSFYLRLGESGSRTSWIQVPKAEFERWRKAAHDEQSFNRFLEEESESGPVELTEGVSNSVGSSEEGLPSIGSGEVSGEDSQEIGPLEADTTSDTASLFGGLVGQF